MNSAPALDVRALSARGRLHGMTVVFKGPHPETAVRWTVLDRHPLNGHWWLHWVTTFARYNQLEQVIS